MFFKILLTAVLVSLCSCQQAEVNVEYNKEIDFFQFKTFAWLNLTEQKERKYTSLKEQKIGSVVCSVLAERGLHFSSENPDVLVAVNLFEKEKVHYSPRFGHHFYHRRWGYYSHWDYYEPDYYLESTLIIALVDTKTKKALWEGSVMDWSYVVSQEETEKMIRALLENYPPTDSESYTPMP